MDGSETTSGHHGDAEIDVVSLTLGWVCLALTSAVLAEGRLNGALDISWVAVSMPALLPLLMAMAYVTAAAIQDRRAGRR